MKITHGPPSPEATRTLEALRKAVQQKLEEKRRLGHYYVVWQDERAVFIGPDKAADGVKSITPTTIQQSQAKTVHAGIAPFI